MPFCASCGAQVEGKFCPKCGAAIVAGGTAPPPPPPPQPPYGAPAPGAYAPPVSAPMADNMASALCYIPFVGWLIGIVFLVMEPYSRNRAIRFQAFQSIFLAVFIVAVDIVFGVVFRLLIEILGFFGLLAGLFWPLWWLACLVLFVYLFITTYQGKTTVLPFIGPFAQKQAQ